MTDGVGAPVLMAFIAGSTSVNKHHVDKSDEEIALAATQALKDFTECVARDNFSTSEISGSNNVSVKEQPCFSLEYCSSDYAVVDVKLFGYSMYECNEHGGSLLP
jgi:hypothetical protein